MLMPDLCSTVDLILLKPEGYCVIVSIAYGTSLERTMFKIILYGIDGSLLIIQIIFEM